MSKPSIYVASSWRNDYQPMVVAALREGEFDVYDFKNPRPGDFGFSWKDVMPSFDIDAQACDAAEYLAGLTHPLAEAGFTSDFDAMQACDACVLVLPCGRSAHLELGWFTGQGKPTAILLDGPVVVPELMYKLADYVADSLWDLCEWALNTVKVAA